MRAGSNEKKGELIFSFLGSIVQTAFFPFVTYHDTVIDPSPSRRSPTFVPQRKLMLSTICVLVVPAHARQKSDNASGE